MERTVIISGITPGNSAQERDGMVKLSDGKLIALGHVVKLTGMNVDALSTMVGQKVRVAIDATNFVTAIDVV